MNFEAGRMFRVHYDNSCWTAVSMSWAVELFGCHSCRNTDRAFVTDGTGSPNPAITFSASTAARLPSRERLTWSVLLGSYSGMGSLHQSNQSVLLLEFGTSNPYSVT